MKKNVSAGWVLSVLFVSALPARADDANAVKAEIRARVQAFHAAASQGDLEAMSSFFSQNPEVMLIGSDPAEVIAGYSNIVSFWDALFQGLAELGYPHGGLPTESSGSALSVGYQGRTAWAADFPTWKLNGGDVPFRITFVFWREQSEWKIVQVHFSLGVPNTQLPL